jgi:uncharacterized protein YcbX
MIMEGEGRVADLRSVTAAPRPARPAVTQLSTTAIKGFRLHHPRSIALNAGGAAGDRDFLLVDETGRSYSVTRTGAFLPYWSRLDADTEVLSVGRDDRTSLEGPVHRGPPVRAHLFGDRYVDGHHVEGPWDAFFSDVAGVPLRLVRTSAPSGGFDVHPVTLLSEASVAALVEATGSEPLDPRVFRLLIRCNGLEPFAEEGWNDAEVSVGSAVLRMGGPVPRCAAVQRHPDQPDLKLDTLRQLNAVRGRQPSELGRTLNLGVYAEVLRPGVVSVGDHLTAG